MLYAVIMAGGTGTRFWPKSRRHKPKQLLTIAGNKTMIRATVDRILPQIPTERIIIIAGEFCADQIRAELPELDAQRIVAEPEGRNTAPCIALAAYKLAKHDPDATMIILPADHVIGEETAFMEALSVAHSACRKNECLITFGIIPDRPETGYGYIELGDLERDYGTHKLYRVKRFVEKPDRPTAEEYFGSGKFLWNSGMFIWSVHTIISAFEKHLPSIARAMESIASDLNTPNEPEALKKIYDDLQSISIDYGIMEKSESVSVIPLNCAWNDVGSWASLYDVWGGDSEGNAVDGMALCLNSNNCVISSTHKLTTVIGCEDLIVVDTNDALLICRKNDAQDVKKLQELLKERGYRNLL